MPEEADKSVNLLRKLGEHARKSWAERRPLMSKDKARVKAILTANWVQKHGDRHKVIQSSMAQSQGMSRHQSIAKVQAQHTKDISHGHSH